MLPFDLSNEQPYDDEAEKYCVHQITLTDDKTVLPSKLLSDSSWVKYVISFLDLETTAAATSKVSESDKVKADLLLIKLREQFKSHVKARVKQSLKQNHWVLKFAYKKLPVVAAAMLLSNHLKIELKCLTKNACLLGYNSNQLIPCLAFPRREGAYLYYDVNREVFVRSGMLNSRANVVVNVKDIYQL